MAVHIFEKGEEQVRYAGRVVNLYSREIKGEISFIAEIILEYDSVLIEYASTKYYSDKNYAEIDAPGDLYVKWAERKNEVLASLKDDELEARKAQILSKAMEFHYGDGIILTGIVGDFDIGTEAISIYHKPESDRVGFETPSGKIGWCSAEFVERTDNKAEKRFEELKEKLFG